MREYAFGLLKQHIQGRPVSPIVEEFGRKSVRSAPVRSARSLDKSGPSPCQSVVTSTSKDAVRRETGNTSVDKNREVDVLTARMAGVTPGSLNDQEVRAEFLRLQTLAAKDTAEFTRKNAQYMLLSVAVLAASSMATLVVTIWK
jgi:hypothetical protein